MRKTVLNLAIAILLAVYFAPLLSRAQDTVPVAPPAAVAQPSDAPAPNVPASQAIPVQQVPSPASPTHATDQIMWGLAASYLLQYLKKSGWFPWLTEQTASRVKAQFGFVAAVLTAAGVHFVVTGNLLDGTGTTITITGISLDAIKDVGFQWVSQQAWYDAIVRPKTPTQGA